jgi:hypothetical protein
MLRRSPCLLFAAAVLIVFSQRSPADEPALAKLDFSRDVRPILSDNCFHCHGPDEAARQADLRLDVKEGLLGETAGLGPVVPGSLDDSELVRRITSDDEAERMPPKDSNRRLTPDQIAAIRRWVEEGAEWQPHWAFVAPARPPLPPVSNRDWPRSAIDAFILAKLDRERLAPSPEASRETLIRRVTLDLTGLPPTPAEVDAFLADDAPDAYEKLVDRLLASPRYGERMVWDWLDAARYADTNGYQGDPERTMWPWRDWAIAAMNANLPFDQFTVEQLAGDLLVPGDQKQSQASLSPQSLGRLIASGFHRNHMFNGEGGRIAEETRVENVMDRVETTGTIWLGATIGCCRCHDHKFDPFTQREYYRLFAFFNNTSEDGRASGGGRSGQIAPVVDVTTPEDNAKLAGFDERVKTLSQELDEFEAELFPHEKDKTPADSPKVEGLSGNLVIALRRKNAQRGSGSLDELIKNFQKDEPDYAQRLSQLKQVVDERDRFQRSLPRVMVMDELEKPRETFVLVRGTYNKPADKVTAGVPAVFPPLPPGDDADVDRLSLARWLVDPQHPLTARVTVNRHWQTFFGAGLVKTVEDFGTQGERPSHPELLDWLATEFVRTGWDVKRLHRLIVTSAAYRQSSRVTPELFERDPENRLLERGPRMRLPSWMLRDQALAASGLLVGKLGGEPVKPYQPEGIWAEATFGKKQYDQDHGESLYRRSVYTFWRRIVGPTMFFDTATRQVCTVKQVRTNTPLHALVTLNDVTYVEAARALAESVLTSDARNDAERIELVVRRLLARRPSVSESKILAARLDELRKQFAEDEESAKKLLSVGESPRNERLDAVDHAAYTALCTLLLNLDETLTKQ